MLFRLTLIVGFICFLTFSVAVPAKNPWRQLNGKGFGKEQNRPESQMQQPEVPIKVDVLPGEYKYVITPLRGPADTAYVVGSIGRFQFKNKKQTYVHLLNEVKEQQIVRQSACRMATYKVDEVVETYTKMKDCIDVTEAQHPSSKSRYENLRMLRDLVFEDVTKEGVDLTHVSVNPNLSMKSTVLEYRTLDVQFRFQKKTKFSEPVQMYGDEWECPFRNEEFMDCIWSPPSRDRAVVKGYKWYESPFGVR